MVVKAQSLFTVFLLTVSAWAGEPVAGVTFVAFDTETTGFSPKNSRIVEIGAVKFCAGGDVLSATNWLMNPQQLIPAGASRVHGITNEMVCGAPLFDEVWPAFFAFCGDSILLAHNARFDVGFLRAELGRAGLDVPALSVVDTLPLFRRWFPDAPSHSLEKLSVFLNIPDGEYHRAAADSFAIVQIFNAGLKRCEGVTIDADDYLKR